MTTTAAPPDLLVSSTRVGAALGQALRQAIGHDMQEAPESWHLRNGTGSGTHTAQRCELQAEYAFTAAFQTTTPQNPQRA